MIFLSGISLVMSPFLSPFKVGLFISRIPVTGAVLNRLAEESLIMTGIMSDF